MPGFPSAVFIWTAECERAVPTYPSFISHLTATPAALASLNTAELIHRVFHTTNIVRNNTINVARSDRLSRNLDEIPKTISTAYIIMFPVKSEHIPVGLKVWNTLFNGM